MLDPKKQRSAARLIHLAASALVGFATYGPIEFALALREASQVAIFPMLTVTGLWLWQGHRVRNWLSAAGDSQQAIARGRN